ncbi:MAG: formyltransferase family protein, partial [Pseudobdellovibrionaceae bacterium]
MKALLVTSAVTFVPENYEGFVAPLASNPQIDGLILIDNRAWDIVAKGLALLLSGAAPRMGWQLLKNYFNKPVKRKIDIFAAQGKKVWVVKDINCAESLELLTNLKPDLLLNARTRSFFRKNLLSIPPLGCVNIHHGLLPHQRGLMCDFWAHLFQTPSGFSIHEMTLKLDDGSLLKVVEVPSDKKNYLATLRTGAKMEALAAQEILSRINSSAQIQGMPNLKTADTVYRKNPKL